MGSLNVCIFWGHYGFIKCVCIFLRAFTLYRYGLIQ